MATWQDKHGEAKAFEAACPDGSRMEVTAVVASPIWAVIHWTVEPGPFGGLYDTPTMVGYYPALLDAMEAAEDAMHEAMEAEEAEEADPVPTVAELQAGSRVSWLRTSEPRKALDIWNVWRADVALQGNDYAKAVYWINR